jgi:hypothetical protein
VRSVASELECDFAGGESVAHRTRGIGGGERRVVAVEEICRRAARRQVDQPPPARWMASANSV